MLTPDRVRRIYRSAVRSAELIVEHTPGVYHGRLDYFSATDHESPAQEWRDHVDGEIVDRHIDAAHDQMTAPSAMAEIGPQLARLLARGSGRRPEGPSPA